MRKKDDINNSSFVVARQVAFSLVGLVSFSPSTHISFLFSIHHQYRLLYCRTYPPPFPFPSSTSIHKTHTPVRVCASFTCVDEKEEREKIGALLVPFAFCCCSYFFFFCFSLSLD